MRVRESFCTTGGQSRTPWRELPGLPAVLRTRLFHYRYERLSNRQGRKKQFDRPIGSVWYEGEMAELSPLVVAAEVLHVGQKATFGLGKVKAVWT